MLDARMELEQLERKVSVLQACVRGFLVRRHFQRLRAEYEAVVQEIDGDLGTLQWTEGWIPTPRFPLQKAEAPWTRPAEERRVDPQRAQQSRRLCERPEKEAICQKTRPEVSWESSAPAGRLPRPDARSWPPGQSRKPCQEGSADGQWMKKSETAGPELPCSQTELQELRSHLAMELLWLQQAINSRKEYLILKQTLRSPEAAQTRDKPRRCPDYDGQVCDNPPRGDQSSSSRITGETDYTDDACWGFRSRPCKSPEQRAITDRSSVWSRDLGQRRTGPQLSRPSKNLTRELGHGKQSLELRNSLEDRAPSSEKVRTQIPAVHDDPHIKDKFPGTLDHKGPHCQRARPQELDLSDDRVFWDGSLVELSEQSTLGLWATKPPKGQTLDERTGNMASHEGWKNQRGVPWRPNPPEKRSPAA